MPLNKNTNQLVTDRQLNVTLKKIDMNINSNNKNTINCNEIHQNYKLAERSVKNFYMDEYFQLSSFFVFLGVFYDEKASNSYVENTITAFSCTSTYHFPSQSAIYIHLNGYSYTDIFTSRHQILWMISIYYRILIEKI